MKEYDDLRKCIDILTPLKAEFFPDERGGEEWEDHDYMYGIPMTGTDLSQYEAVIRGKVEEENRRGVSAKDGICNLMEYFHGSSSIKEKVESAVVSVKMVDGVLYGCTRLDVKDFLEEYELREMCAYITGQYSDGWGEGFEQRDIEVDGGYLNVHFYSSENFCFREQKVLEAPKESDSMQRNKNRPKMELLGHDGNIFAIMGRASRLLKENGQEKEAHEMYERVKASGNYYKALGIVSEYVETELSVNKVDNSKAEKTKKELGGRMER